MRQLLIRRPFSSMRAQQIVHVVSAAVGAQKQIMFVNDYCRPDSIFYLPCAGISSDSRELNPSWRCRSKNCIALPARDSKYISINYLSLIQMSRDAEKNMTVINGCERVFGAHKLIEMTKSSSASRDLILWCEFFIRVCFCWQIISPRRSPAK